MQNIEVLVIGSDGENGLAARLARMGHRVVCAEPAGDLPGGRSWDVIAIDDGGDRDPITLTDLLPRSAAPMMVVGEDPRRVSGVGPVVFCFRDESDDGYARAIQMCAALGGGSRELACSEAALGPRNGIGWRSSAAARHEIQAV